MNRTHFEADQIQLHIGFFQDSLDNWSEEMPKEEVHGLYKVRGKWFQGIISQTRLAIRKGLIIDEQLIEDFRNFADNYIDRKRSTPGFRTSREDIEKGNEMVRRIIENLSKRLSEVVE